MVYRSWFVKYYYEHVIRTSECEKCVIMSFFYFEILVYFFYYWHTLFLLNLFSIQSFFMLSVFVGQRHLIVESSLLPGSERRLSG